MGTGYRGTFVLPWSRTETDGAHAAPPAAMAVGSLWRWTGEAVRVDGPGQPLVLYDRTGEAERRRRAARMVRRLLGAAVTGHDLGTMPDDGDLPQQGFVVTDGTASYVGTLVTAAGSPTVLVMFDGDLPPRDTDLWVIHRMTEGGRRLSGGDPAQGVICFTPGTRMATPDGTRAIEDIRPGDAILTRDNGPQQVLWTGRRHMTGARLHALPHLRPVRIRSCALGSGRPEGDLVVSPGHRMLVQGRAAASLFSSREVLITARDLVGMRGVQVDTQLREVTYIHLMTERHEIVWANGMETESFHPASASLEQIDPNERAALFALMPELEADPFAYGAFARRSLTGPEAALLRHDAA